MDLITAKLEVRSQDYIRARLDKLSKYATENKSLIDYYKLKLSNLGFESDKYYLLCRGHDFENIVIKRTLNRAIPCIRHNVIMHLNSLPDGKKRIARYASATGIIRNTQISARLNELLNDCSNIHLATEGYNLLRNDLEKLFNETES